MSRNKPINANGRSHLTHGEKQVMQLLSDGHKIKAGVGPGNFTVCGIVFGSGVLMSLEMRGLVDGDGRPTKRMVRKPSKTRAYVPIRISAP